VLGGSTNKREIKTSAKETKRDRGGKRKWWRERETGLTNGCSYRTLLGGGDLSKEKNDTAKKSERKSPKDRGAERTPEGLLDGKKN